MNYGYARVSSKEQNLDRQFLALKEAGCETIYADKESGKDFERPEWQKLKEKLKPGDCLIVESLDRLGRDYSMLKNVWNGLCAENIKIKILDLPALDTDDELLSKVIADLMLTLLSYVAETERKFIKKRQREGIDAALLRGVKFGRPAITFSFEEIETYAAVKAGKMKARDAAERLDIPLSTVRGRIKKYTMIKKSAI